MCFCFQEKEKLKKTAVLKNHPEWAAKD